MIKKTFPITPLPFFVMYIKTRIFLLFPLPLLLAVVFLLFTVSSAVAASSWQEKESFFEEEDVAPKEVRTSAKKPLGHLHPGQKVILAPFKLSKDIALDIGQDKVVVQEQKFLRFLGKVLEQYGFLVELAEKEVVFNESAQTVASLRSKPSQKTVEVRDEQGKKITSPLADPALTSIKPLSLTKSLKRSVGTLSGAIGYAQSLEVEPSNLGKKRIKASASLVATTSLLQEHIGAKAFFVQLHSKVNAVVFSASSAHATGDDLVKEISIELALQRLAYDIAGQLAGVTKKEVAPVQKKKKAVNKKGRKKKEKNPKQVR